MRRSPSPCSPTRTTFRADEADLGTAIECLGAAWASSSKVDFSGLSQVADSKQASLRKVEAAKFKGEIHAITWPNKLRKLWLTKTPISGCIEDVQWPEGLIVIGLAGTAVSGDLATVKTWPHGLRALTLSSTDVFGDITDVKWPSTIKELVLYDTKVKGDFSRWLWPESLEILYLSSCAAVTGTITAVDNRFPSTLKLLGLSGTTVHVPPECPRSEECTWRDCDEIGELKRWLQSRRQGGSSRAAVSAVDLNARELDP